MIVTARVIISFDGIQSIYRLFSEYPETNDPECFGLVVKPCSVYFSLMFGCPQFFSGSSDHHLDVDLEIGIPPAWHDRKNTSHVPSTSLRTASNCDHCVDEILICVFVNVLSYTRIHMQNPGLSLHGLFWHRKGTWPGVHSDITPLMSNRRWCRIGCDMLQWGLICAIELRCDPHLRRGWPWCWPAAKWLRRFGPDQTGHNSMFESVSIDRFIEVYCFQKDVFGVFVKGKRSQFEVLFVNV